MDNYVEISKNEKFQGKKRWLEPKYTFTCVYCGMKFVTVDPLSEICPNCMTEYSDDICLMGNAEDEI